MGGRLCSWDMSGCLRSTHKQSKSRRGQVVPRLRAQGRTEPCAEGRWLLDGELKDVQNLVPHIGLPRAQHTFVHDSSEPSSRVTTAPRLACTSSFDRLSGETRRATEVRHSPA